MDLTPHQEQEGQSGEAATAEGGASASAGADGGAGDAAPSKPLEQEPLLAARIMIEDCMALLLDVEDIDRIFVAAGGGELGDGAWREGPGVLAVGAQSLERVCLYKLLLGARVLLDVGH